MKRMKVVLHFPEDIVEDPITYNLISDYGVQVNILRASINPGKQGMMVVELSAEENRLSRGLNYLERVGVQVEAPQCPSVNRMPSFASRSMCGVLILVAPLQLTSL